MDLSLKEFVQILVTVFGGGLASYVAIRSDIAAMKARVSMVEHSTDEAHKRIDSVLMADRRTK
jgi:hypothetical protein